jgi:DNA primase
VRAAGFKATLQAIENVIKKKVTHCSMHVLVARMGEMQGPPDEFFMKEEERALSEASYGSMPSLVTPPASSTSE